MQKPNTEYLTQNICFTLAQECQNISHACTFGTPFHTKSNDLQGMLKQMVNADCECWASIQFSHI
jgi:hypothetical protein